MASLQQTWQLPVGYLDASGVLHREIELRALTGREEELLTGDERSTAERVTEVLSRCVKRIGSIDAVTPTLVRGLLVGDRQYLLLMLRQLTFGDRVQAALPCPWPGCGKGVDIDFRISQIPITGCADVRSSYSVVIASQDGESGAPIAIEYRLPTGIDQEIVVAIPGHEALTCLLSRCLLRLGDVDNPDVATVASLAAGVRRQIEQEIEARAPSLDLTMDVACLSCQRSFIAPFALQDFFFGELRISADILYREIHYLAFHYHWSEAEIMSMPRARRRRYIDVLSSEIEKLNASAEPAHAR